MRFEFIKVLGSGGTGVVELHRDTERGGARVALKRIHSHLNFTPEQEATLALSVTHRNCCRVYDVHRDGDTVVIAMEYVDGETLREILKRSGRMPIPSALSIIKQVLDGLEEAHAKGIIHCDIKPENVMVDRDGVVKIMDFGLAIRLQTTIGIRDQSGQIVGTPGYLAPEQAAGKPSDKRTDIYHVGSLLFEMLTGRDARKKPWTFPDDLPADVRAVIEKCSKDNPDRRFQSAAEMRSALAEPSGVRPLRSYTGILVASLLLTIALAALFFISTRPRRAGAVGSAGAAKTAEVVTNPTLRPVTPTVSPDAAKIVADGKYFLDNEMFDDALTQFDRALQLDGDLTEAHFQRGRVLVKLKRWDDAIASFKRALPGSASGRRMTWEWKSNFSPGSAHGVIWVKPNRVLYGERKGKNTVLQLIDLEQHRIRSLQLPDDRIHLNDGGFTNDQMIVLMSYEPKTAPTPNRFTLHAISVADAAPLWHIDLDDSGPQLPWVGVGARGLATFLPGKHTLAFYSEKSSKPVWTRDDLQFDRTTLPVGLPDRIVIHENTTHGPRYHALNLDDGADAWTVDLPEIATSVPPMRDGNVVYFVSKQSEIVAVEVGGKSGQILWHQPAGKGVVSLRAGAGQIYAGTASGELRVLDAKTGEIGNTRQIETGALSVDYVGPSIVITSSATSIRGVGGKSWEYPSRYPKKNVSYAEGIVLARTADDEITALDADSGALLWQHNGHLVADGVFTTRTGLFIADEGGVKQYATQKPSGNVTDKQILTEVANALLNEGNVADASAFIDKIEHELDPASSQLRLLRARLSLASEKAKGHVAPVKAGADLAAFAVASGLTSEASRPVIADLKTGYDLLWARTVDSILPGSPARVGRWLMNLGFGTGVNMQILAVNPETGEPAWRQPAQRFVDSVAATGAASGRVFYVTGDNAEPTAVSLRSIDIARGEAADIARWSRTQPVVFGHIALASGRLFVLTISANIQTNTAELAVDAFDAASGKQLWPSKIHETSTLFPIGLFTPQGDTLVYSADRDIWTVRAVDGVVLDHQQENNLIGPNPSHDLVPAGPLYYVTTRREISAYDPVRKQITNSRRPEVDSAQLTIRDGMLFGTDKGSLYGFVLEGDFKWQLPATDTARFLNFVDGDKSLWALRDDNVLVAIDRDSGKLLQEQSTLWRPAAYTISSGRMYAFTADGVAYAVRLKTR